MAKINIEDVKNYKKCSKKSYEVYACIPEAGTCIINRLHNTDLYKRYRKEYMTAEQAKKYQGLPLADGNQVCIYGVAGEFSLVPLQVVLNNYVLENGMSVSVDELKKRWVKLKAKSNFREFFACFVPKIQIEHLGRMTVNGDGNFINHGKGDFIVCDSINGKPNMNTRRVVNGLIFANTYNNQGWTNCISSVNLIAYENLPNLVVNNIDNGIESYIFDKLCELLEKLKQNAVTEMPFNYKRYDNEIHIKPAVIEDYRTKADEVAERSEKFSHFITVVKIRENKLLFKSYNVYDNRKELTYMFDLPASDDGLSMFKANINVYAGLLGFIPNGVQNCFSFVDKPTKYEHDGVHSYTISSSGINRKLRLQDYESEDNHRGYERIGTESQRLYRAIDGADRYFDKVELIKPITVFRGMPACDAVLFSGKSNLKELSGGVITNTAYTSSTLNLHSTLLFAKVVKDKNDGVILAIDLPKGTHADYIHNIAGWKEQFEVLWDRKYDIIVKEELLSFKGGENFTYHVFRAGLVEHAPMSPLPAFIDVSHHSDIPNINLYDKNGRVNFDYENIKGVMLETFDILKKKGLSGIQYQTRLKIDPLQRDYIVVHAGEEDNGNIVVDLGFTYNTDINMIDVIRFKSKNRVSYKDNKGNDVVATVRNYWSDWGRNNGAIDQNFSWESYNANDKGFDIRSNNFSFEPKSSITIKKPKNLEKVTLADGIAYTILEYVKYNKDVTLLPMQDVARYFDTVFKNVIIDEGYYLKDSCPVNRVGKDTDENDGYVPLKYKIDGDNDDTLTLMMHMSKDDNGKLQLEYRGMSANKKVKERDTLRWDIFNESIMERECNKILYVFASKLNLNHTRKADKLMNFLSRNRGFIITKGKNECSNGKNIHEMGNSKAYKLWYNNHRDYVSVILSVKNNIYSFKLQDNLVFDIDSRLSLVEMYRIFIEQLEGVVIK